jgi:methyl-accepting chemotaxis protein
MGSKPHVFRRRYYLKGSLQPRLLRRMIGLFVVVILMSATAFYLLADSKLADEFYKAHQTIEYTREAFLPWLIAINIVAIVLTIFLAIFPSHKVAGPVLHLQRDLEKIENGEFPEEIKVRKGDLLKEFAEHLNKSMKSVGDRITIVKGDLSELDKCVASLEQSADIPEEYLKEIRRLVSQSTANMDHFKIAESRK